MNPRPAYTRYWWSGFSFGLRALSGARNPFEVRAALRFLCCPVDLWRYHEIAAVASALGRPSAALSIGSPTVAPVVLADGRFPLFVTDFASGAVYEAGNASTLRPSIYPVQCDALRLPFSDNSLPFVMSVSAFEHFGGEGDSVAAREVFRVLTAGGIAVLTVPIVPDYFERWVGADPYGKQARDSEGRVFFSRYYDAIRLRKRIVEPSGLEVSAAYAWQEQRPGWYDQYCRRTEVPDSLGSILTKILDPVWACTCLVPVSGGIQAVERHGLAALILRKPR